jgi:hypothetical protein
MHFKQLEQSLYEGYQKSRSSSNPHGSLKSPTLMDNPLDATRFFAPRSWTLSHLFHSLETAYHHEHGQSIGFGLPDCNEPSELNEDSLENGEDGISFSDKLSDKKNTSHCQAFSSKKYFTPVLNEN